MWVSSAVISVTSVGMIEEFGSERVRDTPISENAISGAAIGAAMTGMRPIVDVTFMDFIVYMMDNIVNQAAKTRYMFGGKGQIPVVFRVAAGGGVGSAAQQFSVHSKPGLPISPASR